MRTKERFWLIGDILFLVGAVALALPCFFGLLALVLYESRLVGKFCSSSTSALSAPS